MYLIRSASIISVVLIGLSACSKKEEHSPSTPAPALLSSTPQPPFVVVAHLVGSTETPVRTQVAGYLVRQDYKEGATVKEGDLLFELDSRSYEKALNRAEAQLADRRARLVPVEIIKEGVAQVNRAKSDLAATRIFAPADGVAGAARHGLGDMVLADGTLAEISQANPIKAVFSVQGKLSDEEVKSMAKDLDLPLEARPETVELILPNGTAYSTKGKWVSFNEPSSATGAPTASTLFGNKDGTLQPGEDVKVRITHP